MAALISASHIAWKQERSASLLRFRGRGSHAVDSPSRPRLRLIEPEQAPLDCRFARIQKHKGGRVDPLCAA